MLEVDERVPLHWSAPESRLGSLYILFFSNATLLDERPLVDTAITLSQRALAVAHARIASLRPSPFH